MQILRYMMHANTSLDYLLIPHYQTNGIMYDSILAITYRSWANGACTNNVPGSFSSLSSKGLGTMLIQYLYARYTCIYSTQMICD